MSTHSAARERAYEIKEVAYNRVASTLSPRRRANTARVRDWRDRHRGEQCVIIGNGPSLNKTDLGLLKGRQIFGLNRLYLMRERLGFEPAYTVVVNPLVVQQCAEDFAAMRNQPLFTTWANAPVLGALPHINYLFGDPRPTKFSHEISTRISEGFTVTYVAMQIAYYMGFEDVVLVGVDHRFSTKGTPNATVTSTGDDPNHFDPKYFGAGFRWQLPDLEGSEHSYRLARAAFERDGRRIADATVDGALTVFPKADLADALRPRATA